MTSLGRKSTVFGNASGGSGYVEEVFFGDSADLADSPQAYINTPKRVQHRRDHWIMCKLGRWVWHPSNSIKD
jgi:hypothetical protein